MADNALKALIRKTETGKTDPTAQYNTIIGHFETYLPKPITEMTVDEIIAASDKWRKQFGTTSGAAGAYQIIKPTLVSLKQRLGLSGREKFTAELQDRMCDELLIGRGFSDFMSGHDTVQEFGNALAREWASFPVLSTQKRGSVTLKRGQSYYDKFAGNSALIKPETVEATLLMLRAPQATPGAVPPVVPIPTALPGDAPNGPEALQDALNRAKKEPLLSPLDWIIGAIVVAAVLAIAYLFWPR